MTKTEWLWFTIGPLIVGGIVLLVVWLRSNFVKVRVSPMRISCSANLKHMEGAIHQWALEHKKVAIDTFSLIDPVLLSYMKGSRLPVCPAGGFYLEGLNVTNAVKCTLAYKGHTL